MVPFVLARPSRSGFTAVPSEVLAPKLERDLAFFAARGIVLRERKDTEMMVTFSKTTVTKSTETGSPPYDSDERTFEQVDDTPSDPDN